MALALAGLMDFSSIWAKFFNLLKNQYYYTKRHTSFVFVPIFIDREKNVLPGTKFLLKITTNFFILYQL